MNNNGLDTLPKYLKRNYALYGKTRTAMRVKEMGYWQPYTWHDYYENVKWLSLGLISLGLKKGDKICIIGESKPQWIWAEVSAQAAGCTPVGVFTDCMPDEVKYFVNHSDANFVIAEDQEQVDKILQIKADLPQLKKVIFWDEKGLWGYDDPILMSFDKLIEAGKKYESENAGLFEQNIAAGNGEDICVFCYTSGTTGLPRAAMISHRSLINVASTQAKYDNLSSDDNYVAFFSPAWVADQITAVAGGLVAGFTVNFVEKPETIMENIREIGPEVLGWGPRNWESVMRTVQAKISNTSALKRFIYNLFIPIAMKKSYFIAKNKKPDFLWRIAYFIGYWIVYRNLLDKFGLTRVRVARTGGSAISPDMIQYFQSMGVNIEVGYGLSEAPMVATHFRDNLKPETTGPPAVGMDVRLSGEGQMLVRGQNMFSGYFKDIESTNKKVIDGWYHTGDFGNIDENGHLIVMDRMDDLRQLAGGHKFSPQYIEIRLRFSQYIKEAIIIGDEKYDYVSAIINIDLDNVGHWAEAKRIPYTTFVDLSQKPEVIALIRNEIEKVNRLLPADTKVKKFTNLHREFDPDEAELTRTRKLRRTYVEERYKDLIHALYSGAEELTVEASVTYRDGRKGTTKTALKINKLD